MLLMWSSGGKKTVFVFYYISDDAILLFLPRLKIDRASLYRTRVAYVARYRGLACRIYYTTQHFHYARRRHRK